MISIPAILMFICGFIVANYDQTHGLHSLLPFVFIGAGIIFWYMDWDVSRRNY